MRAFCYLFVALHRSEQLMRNRASRCERRERQSNPNKMLRNSIPIRCATNRYRISFEISVMMARKRFSIYNSFDLPLVFLSFSLHPLLSATSRGRLFWAMAFKPQNSIAISLILGNLYLFCCTFALKP